MLYGQSNCILCQFAYFGIQRASQKRTSQVVKDKVVIGQSQGWDGKTGNSRSLPAGDTAWRQPRRDRNMMEITGGER